MQPDDIPTPILSQIGLLVRNIPGTNRQNVITSDDAAAVIAHHWPAIERHIREQVAQQLHDQNPDRDADFTAGVDWAIDTIRNPR